MKVLITGGAGYIGSTVTTVCDEAGHQTVVIDDLSTGRVEFVRNFVFYAGDYGDVGLLDRVAREHPDIDVVVHCAAKIVVPESVLRPLDYFETNVAKIVPLLRFCERTGVRRLVFSSSASIYASVDGFYVDEDAATDPQSPYATTKLMTEQILRTTAEASDLRVVSLRYFNPVGADPQLRTGQQLPHPTHLMGQLLEAHRTGGEVTIFGTDWPTRDGTAVRDFIHVWDLARAHVNAIERLDTATANQPFVPVNIGTGAGTTVRELVDAFRSVVGAGLRVAEGPRRTGDQVGTIARIDRARTVLGWTPERSEASFVEDSLRWLERRLSVLGY